MSSIGQKLEQVRSFKTNRFTVTCYAEFDAWPDPLVFSEEIRNGIEKGRYAVWNFSAYVYLHETQLGRGSVREILAAAEPDENYGLEIFSLDPTHINEAIRYAISDARRQLDQLDGPTLGIRIRKSGQNCSKGNG